MTMHESRLRIAVLGAGVAGIVAAYLLSRRHDVTLYERNDYIGGHTNTIAVPGGKDGSIPVDTGFIVFNDRTYPLFNRFLDQLGVRAGKTDMSFSYADQQSSLCYASRDLDSLFAQRKNLFRPSFWRFVDGMLRFNRITRSRLHEGALSRISLGEHLEREGFGDSVARAFVLPMAGAIWSAPDGDIRSFPAETFARFYENHGLLSLRDHPQWYYVAGGSSTYVRAFLKSFPGGVHLSSPVVAVERTEAGIVLKLPGGEERYDGAVIATHADEALLLLADPSDDEVRLLLPWRYAANRTILHRDTSFLPPNRRAWASWNYIRPAGGKERDPVTLTYDMTRLQHLPADAGRICVTLNPWREIAPSSVIRSFVYSHPMYSFDALATQSQLPILNGRRHTYFCGSYFGYGFHEDAVRSAVEVARQFGIEL
ncbi:Predicted NAD/FAD-binding protein [Syntrophus gentianae]|uniref:Predicted NAD/FAD-binding protein n=2 Tax=Syntrophus gentianae TaxID=43775 RepID=A0A1H7YFS6_9BACT|nr:Predicted NAD/FAD-binding protein [Syntrophus gentianae]